MASTQPDPKSASPFSHTAEVAVASTQPEPKSASPSGQASVQDAGMKSVHLPVLRLRTSSWSSPRWSHSLYRWELCPMERCRLFARLAVLETVSPPDVTVTVTRGALR